MRMMMGRGADMVADLKIQYTLQGSSHTGTLTSVNPGGCVIKGDAKADIGDVLFLSFEKGIPLGGFKGKVIGQTFQEQGWTMGMHFVGLTQDEKEMLFDRITYFSFLQEKIRKKMMEEVFEERNH